MIETVLLCICDRIIFFNLSIGKYNHYRFPAFLLQVVNMLSAFYALFVRLGYVFFSELEIKILALRTPS